jgi:hypothetical protein
VAEAGAEAKGAAARQPVFRPFLPQNPKTRLKKPIFQLFSRKNHKKLPKNLLSSKNVSTFASRLRETPTTKD